MARALIALPVLALTVLGCSGERDPSELLGPSAAGVPVVQAVLIVDQPLPVVRLSRTTDPGVPYSASSAALGGASVRVLEGDSTFVYTEVSAGRYLPPDPAPLVKPGTTYRLDVLLADGDEVRAATLTPARLESVRWLVLDDSGTMIFGELRTFADVGDAVYAANRLRHSEGLLEARFARPPVPGFQVALFSLDSDSEFAVDVSFLDDEDLEDIDRESSSPVILAEDGRLRLPWLAVAFVGRYLVRVHAVDRNWFDLIRSFPELTGGGPPGGFGGNAGDDFASPIFHVEGGIGLFGSASVDSVGFSVLAAQ